MKVIFLDIDGVLNHRNTKTVTANGFTFVDNNKVKLLKNIVNATKAKIVLSSDWRYDRNEPILNSDFLELKDKLAEFGLYFFDFTPEINWQQREMEIQTWLNEHPEVDKLVILDDRTDFPTLKNHLVHTKTDVGLTEIIAIEAIITLADDNITC